MKKTIFILMTTVVLLAGTAFARIAPTTGSFETSPLVGTWKIVISAPGQEMPGTLTISSVADGKYEGSLTTDLGVVPLRNVVVNGESFTSEMTANVQGQSFEGTMNGNLKDSALTGEINLSGLGAIPYSGSKN